MAGELADWQRQLPERSRYGIVGALDRRSPWELIARNPARLAGRNPHRRRGQCGRTPSRSSTRSPPSSPAVTSRCRGSSPRPEEWRAAERRDVDRRVGVVNVSRTVSEHEVVELGKTCRSHRQVPLSRRATTALEALPARLGTPLLIPSRTGELLHESRFARREWRPAIKAAGIATPARLYDVRSTFASNALAAGVTVFELPRVMGTSVLTIERHYGALLDGAHAGIAGRSDALGGPARAGRRRGGTVVRRWYEGTRCRGQSGMPIHHDPVAWTPGTPRRSGPWAGSGKSASRMAARLRESPTGSREPPGSGPVRT
jgi:hypothetical protein